MLDMSPFSQRLNEAVEEAIASKRQFDPPRIIKGENGEKDEEIKAIESQRDIEKVVGISRGYLSRLLKGEEGATKRGSNPSVDMTDRLSEALGVRSKWLSDGELPKERGDDPLPERAAAVRWARDAGYPEDVIQRAYRARKGPRLTYEQWIDRLRAWKLDHDTGVEELGEPATAEDFPKPRT